MVAAIIEFLKDLPPEFATMIIAMIPVTELRVSIPVALGPFDLSVVSAIFWSVLGDMVPATIILIFISDIAEWFCRRSGAVNRVYQRWVARTTKKFQSGFARYGAAIALAIFVGIPLPFTGSWSGALAAFIFGIPKRVAFVAIFIGVIIAAFIVTGISLGAIKLFF